MRHLTRTSIRAELAAPLDGQPLPGAHGLRAEGATVTFEVDTPQLDAALRALTEIGVRSLVSRPPTLEELFLRHYKDELQEAVRCAPRTPGRPPRTGRARRR
jgi:ABC-2 type transport system ATP-binding protein